jgi:hypothetical protein
MWSSERKIHMLQGVYRGLNRKRTVSECQLDRLKLREAVLPERKNDEIMEFDRKVMRRLMRRLKKRFARESDYDSEESDQNILSSSETQKMLDELFNDQSIDFKSIDALQKSIANMNQDTWFFNKLKLSCNEMHIFHIFLYDEYYKQEPKVSESSSSSSQSLEYRFVQAKKPIINPEYGSIALQLKFTPDTVPLPIDASDVCDKLSSFTQDVFNEQGIYIFESLADEIEFFVNPEFLKKICDSDIKLVTDFRQGGHDVAKVKFDEDNNILLHFERKTFKIGHLNGRNRINVPPQLYSKIVKECRRDDEACPTEVESAASTKEESDIEPEDEAGSHTEAEDGDYDEFEIVQGFIDDGFHAEILD